MLQNNLENPIWENRLGGQFCVNLCAQCYENWFLWSNFLVLETEETHMKRSHKLDGGSIAVISFKDKNCDTDNNKW